MLNCVQDQVPKFNSKTKNSTRKKYPLYIRKLFNTKTLVWKIFKKAHSDKVAAKYKVIEGKCTAELHNYVSKVENHLICNGNLDYFYRYVNNKTIVKRGVALLQDTVGVTHTNDLSKANALNDYFASVFTTDNGCLPNRDDVNINQPDNNMEAVYLSPEPVRSVIKKLKNKNIAGIDGLPAILFKQLSNALSFLLSMLLNLSMSTSKLPANWKSAALIIPLFM